MNIAYFIQVKSEVAFLYGDFTFRQGLEKMRYHGYTAIPVLSKDNKYIGTISEGDFLWHLIDDTNDELQKISMKSIENMKIEDILINISDKNPPVKITSSIEELLTKSMDQNFIPVIDDRDYFIGIITRRDIIKHFLDTNRD